MKNVKNNKINPVSSVWLPLAIKVGLFVSLFMPLIIGNQFIFPFIFPKQAFFQIVVEIIFGLYLFLALRQPQYRPRSSWLWRALIAYFAIMVLSSVFGVNAYHSFWSNYERMAGVINLLHYLGFLFIAANVFKTKEDWFRFFDFSILASVLEALYGLGQLVGISAFLHGSGSRIDGTIGNPSFLAGYMLISALFALWLMLEKKSGYWRIIYGAVIVINIFVMYKTETRGAMLAFIAAAFVLSLFFIFASRESLSRLPLKNPSRLRIYFAIGFAIFIIAVGSIWLARNSDFVIKNPALSRLTHISLQESTSQTRLLAWQMSLKGFKERPIFGWGPENYYVLFNKYYNPNLYPTESWFDRSHNAYLDVLVNTGAVGFAAYISIFVLALWCLWRNWRQKNISYQTFTIFVVVLIAYGIQNVVLFDTQVTLLMIFSILAYLVFLSFNFSTPKTIGQPVRPNLIFIGVVFLVAIFSLYFINIKPGLAGATGIDSIYWFQQKDIKTTVEVFNEAYKIGTFGLPEVAMRANELAMQSVGNSNIANEDQKKMIGVAIDGMKKSLELEPLNARFMLMLSNIYMSALSLEPAYLPEADVTLQKALELSPTRQEIYFGLGQLRVFQGNNTEALAMFKKAVELNDKVSLSHWNYGVIAVAVGQKELGETEINKSLEMGHSYEPGDIQYLINAFSRQSDWQKVVQLYKDWIQITPNDATPYAGLAASYAQIGDKQSAKEWAQKAIEINPQFKEEGEKFIQSLGL